jgi:hypothetical protein
MSLHTYGGRNRRRGTRLRSNPAASFGSCRRHLRFSRHNLVRPLSARSCRIHHSRRAMQQSRRRWDHARSTNNKRPTLRQKRSARKARVRGRQPRLCPTGRPRGHQRPHTPQPCTWQNVRSRCPRDARCMHWYKCGDRNRTQGHSCSCHNLRVDVHTARRAHACRSPSRARSCRTGRLHNSCRLARRSEHSSSARQPCLANRPNRPVLPPHPALQGLVRRHPPAARQVAPDRGRLPRPSRSLQRHLRDHRPYRSHHFQPHAHPHWHARVARPRVHAAMYTRARAAIVRRTARQACSWVQCDPCDEARHSLQRRSVELILDRAADLPRSQGATTPRSKYPWGASRSGDYGEKEQRGERGRDQARQNQFNRPPL